MVNQSLVLSCKVKNKPIIKPSYSIQEAYPRKTHMCVCVYAHVCIHTNADIKGDINKIMFPMALLGMAKKMKTT